MTAVHNPDHRVASGAAPTKFTTAPTSLIGVLGATGVVLGILLTTFGLSWDVQWHTDVGPDTFFTASHLMLYSGSAIAGVASLAMVLYSTGLQRTGRTLPRSVGGTPVRVFGGAFTAPLGYLVSGVGAASFLLFGVIDLGWHSIYGFDAVLNSPPHVALFLSISLTMVGSLIIGSAARATAWGKAIVIVSIAVLITFTPIAANALADVPLPFDATIATSALVAAILLIVAATQWRRAGAAVVVALVLGTLQAALWAFSPWAAHAYAAVVGLPLRDGLTAQPPKLPSSIPIFLIIAAIAVELLVIAIRSRRLGRGVGFLLAGTVTGTIVALSLPVQLMLFDPTQSFSPIVLTLVAVSGAVFGAIGGYLGPRISGLLLSAGPAESTTISNALSEATA
jgi:hypothetical protein